MPMRFPFHYIGRVPLGCVVFAALLMLGGCSAGEDRASTQAVANDPQRAAEAGQRAAVAEAENQRARQEDEARRAPQR